MLADFNFYKTRYNGLIITDANIYEHFGERAGDELALYSNKAVFSNNNEEAQNALKRCACRIADILYSQYNTQKDGKNILSESVAGYYSATYGDVTNEQIKHQINSAIKLYIGRYLVGARKVAW